MKTLIKIIVIIMLILACLFGIFIYSNAKEEPNLEEDKVAEEITYLNTKLTTIMNKINGIQIENYKLVVTKIQKDTGSSSSGEEKGKGKSEENSGESSEKNSKTNGKDSEESENTDEKEQTITRMEKEQTLENSKEVNWEWIQGETEIIYSVWPTVVLDLSKTNIDSNKILEFSSGLDQALMSIKEKDSKKACTDLAKIYGLIPEFAESIKMDDITKQVLKAKANIINAYAYVGEENWDSVNKEIESAESNFVQIINNLNNEEDQRKYIINKSYILIEELKNSLPTKEKDIFFIKYKNLIEEMNALI